LGVEIKQYLGEGVRALVPRQIASPSQSQAGGTTEIGRWDEHAVSSSVRPAAVAQQRLADGKSSVRRLCVQILSCSRSLRLLRAAMS
jgi:hypothetical protein